jgi:hypothetical protein
MIIVKSEINLRSVDFCLPACRSVFSVGYNMRSRQASGSIRAGYTDLGNRLRPAKKPDTFCDFHSDRIGG